MSVEKMTLATVFGPQEQLDAAIRTLVINQDVHPVDALPLVQKAGRIQRFTETNPYAVPLQSAISLAGDMGLALGYREFFGEDFTIETVTAFLKERRGEYDKLKEAYEQQEKTAASYGAMREQLGHLQGIEENLAALPKMRYVKCRFGRLPTTQYEDCLEEMKATPSVLYLRTGEEGAWTYGIYFVLPSAKDKVDARFASMGFERIRFLETMAFGGTPEVVKVQLENANAKILAEMESLKKQIADFTEQWREALLIRYSWLTFQDESFRLRDLTCRWHDTFFLTCWVPAADAEVFSRRAAALEKVECVLAEPEEMPEVTPPTKVKNNVFSRIFSPFLKMYGLPAYNEMDPTFFMAITYVLFFGIMFGDVGQGLGLAILGFILYKVKKMWLGGIITACGLAGTVFGFVYGSVFGFEDILPGFKILEGSNVTTLLILSLGLGVVMLVLVMVLNVINGIRQRDWEKVFFGPNGAAGMVFYIGIIVAALCTLFAGVNLFTAAYVLPVLILPLVLILFREPLGKLLKKDPGWKKVSLGSLLVSGFFELFETLLSYLTNTLSFLRVGAYAITHVGLMLVVQTLAGANLNPIVIIIGNLFVMGFEGLLVGIQVLRLEFYELFGRFYGDSGRAFTPRIVDYSGQAAQ